MDSNPFPLPYYLEKEIFKNTLQVYMIFMWDFRNLQSQLRLIFQVVFEHLWMYLVIKCP